MSQDIGLDRYGSGHERYLTRGYLPHEDKYNRPTIDGGAGAVIRKSGIYDGRTNVHLHVDQASTREDTTHGWYDENETVHPFDRLTTPSNHNAPDFDHRYSWSTAVLHAEHGRLETGPLARQLVGGGAH